MNHCTQKEYFPMLKPFSYEEIIAIPLYEEGILPDFVTILTRRIHYCFPQQSITQMHLEKIIKTLFECPSHCAQVSTAALRSSMMETRVKCRRDAGQMPAYFACLLLLHAATDDRAYNMVPF